MNKILQIAWREFVATVATKSFLAGLLIPPLIIGVLSVVMPLIINEEAPRIEGELAIVDPTGKVTEGVEAYLDPEAIAERRGEFLRKVDEVSPIPVSGISAASGSDEMIDSVLGDVPLITVVPVDSIDLEAAKQELHGEAANDASDRLAVAVIDDDAVVRAEGETKFGRYELFVRDKLDERVIGEFRDALRDSITNARIRESGQDPDFVRSLTRVGRVKAVTVTEEGEKANNEVVRMLLPMGFMMLLVMAVMTGGTYLLTSTLEEKSSRVVEVILSAVSPMQLMAGKILGQLAVGTLLLSIYGGIAILAMATFALIGLVEPILFVYLFIFFVIAYFMVGSFLAAVGAAANEMREAQSLQTPLIMMLIIPWMLWMPISRDPNALWATILSFIPPISPFVMVIRISSATPPPFWQVALSILVGIAGVFVIMWGAAKVFRVGLLLHGKAPNWRTLMRWIRMA